MFLEEKPSFPKTKAIKHITLKTVTQTWIEVTTKPKRTILMDTYKPYYVDTMCLQLLIIKTFEVTNQFQSWVPT